MKKLLILLAICNINALKHNLFLNIGFGGGNIEFEHGNLIGETEQGTYNRNKKLLSTKEFLKKDGITELETDFKKAEKDCANKFYKSSTAPGFVIGADLVYKISAEDFHCGLITGYRYINGSGKIKLRATINGPRKLDIINMPNKDRSVIEKKGDEQAEKLKAYAKTGKDQYIIDVEKYELNAQSHMIKVGLYAGKDFAAWSFSIGGCMTVNNLKFTYKEGFKFNQEAENSVDLAFGAMPFIKFDMSECGKIGAFVEVGYNIAFGDGKDIKFENAKEAAEYLALRIHTLSHLKLKSAFLMTFGLTYKII